MANESFVLAHSHEFKRWMRVTVKLMTFSD
jgi:hypothetical protein